MNVTLPSSNNVLPYIPSDYYDASQVGENQRYAQNSTDALGDVTLDSVALISGLVNAANPDDEETNIRVRTALSSKEAIIAMADLRGTDAQSIINLLDHAMITIPPNSPQYKTGFHTLRKLCLRNGFLPKSFVLPSEMIRKSKEQPEASGSFADVWHGFYGNREVALKVVRITSAHDVQIIMKNFCKEAVVWKFLSHANIAPFLGINTTVSKLCMVSEWMSKGNIRTFLCENPGANRLALVVDIASGLNYLHSCGVVHGDLKGVNILINDAGHACLTDFGIAAVIYDANTLNTSTVGTVSPGSTRWMAPEMLDPESAGISGGVCAIAESDVYAFAMVMWEVFTGSIPYVEYRIDAAVIRQVLRGARPKCPTNAAEQGLSDTIWMLMEMCWSPDWKARPSMAFVNTQLNEVYHPSWEHNGLDSDFRQLDTSTNDNAASMVNVNGKGKAKKETLTGVIVFPSRNLIE